MDEEVLCPVCGQPNPADLETCQVCGARLNPPRDKTIQPGQEPIKKDTSEFEKVKPESGDEVHPGEAPTKKNTAELEKALPSWLRSVRENKDSEQGESSAGDSSDQNLPLGTSPSSSSGNIPDWLAGLGQAAADEEEEEIPEWLAGLNAEKSEPAALSSEPDQEPGSFDTENPFAGPNSYDLSSPQEGGPPAEESGWPIQETPSFDQASQEAIPSEGFPDWLKPIESGHAGEDAPRDHSKGSQEEGETPGWPESMANFGSSEGSGEEGTGTPQEKDESPDWLSDLPAIPDESKPPGAPTEGAVPAENLPDWLNQLSDKAIPAATEPGELDDSAKEGKPIPDWLAEAGETPESTPAETAPASGDETPDWLSKLEAQAGPAMGRSTALSGSEPTHAEETQNEVPDWLLKFQTEAKASSEVSNKSEQPEAIEESEAGKRGAEPLPDWLAGLRPSEAMPEENKPAFATGDESSSAPQENAPAFSVDTPDWLSEINPEQTPEKASRGEAEQAESSNLDVSNLPSWVQAMRPLEAVVSEAESTSSEGSGILEQGGPLAGLRGVLPVQPGLGRLSKPPAYSIKLQASDTQQRYAAALDRLVSSETHPQEITPARVVTNRLWRWIISIILIAVISLPLVSKTPLVPASELKPPEMINAFTLIGSLTPNSAVLVVFDYSPALSGELEAAAAPLMDHLLFQGPRLTLISTSPTGPALAERFLHDTNISPLVAGHNYQSGQQYVDLGYLAGGPSGIQLFAQSPSTAAPYTFDGQYAWQAPPLQEVQKLSDFAAILVLTDSADTGRAWVEQTSTSIGNTPMLMVISAQAEPMLLPYYDSGQIKGLVTGLAGGEDYAQTFLRPDGLMEPVQQYWNSFSTGILAAVILIVLGALWNVFSSWRDRLNKKGERV
jgi:hypothetical protein